jgi:hypothetical protein
LLMITLTKSHDVVVCGGGLAGFCAALSAARQGFRSCLVQDRPVLGGNASSEIRVTVQGAAGFHAYARESGIIGEILAEERARNHEEINDNGWTNSVFDQVLYDLALRESNLTLYLNTSVFDLLLGDDDLSAVADQARRPEPDSNQGWFHRPACAPRPGIAAVVARVGGAETTLVLRGSIFIDCTGDGLLADLAGCGWRIGTESRAQTGESHAAEKASTSTLGSSLHIRARDTGRPAPFRAPSWAKPPPGPEFFRKGRDISDLRGGYWWLELGTPWHTIHDNETLRHELTEWALLVWDWIKNHDESTRERAANYALEWIGQVPGKRESRRIDGLVRLQEQDLDVDKIHSDEIAFGGWYVDLHAPGGLLAPHSKAEGAFLHRGYVGPYGIPLRSLIARDVENLLFAGRCVSATHAALGSLRVMGTTALMGQAAGTAAAQALRHALSLARLAEKEQVAALQQTLLRDGCFLPHVARADPLDHAPSSSTSASTSALNHGIDPDEADTTGGLARHPARPSWPLNQPASQWIAVAGGRIGTLAVCLDNAADCARTVRARLVRPEHIWDYRRDLPALAETELTVPAGAGQWVEWRLDLDGVPDGFVRLDLESVDASIAWRIARDILYGQVSARAHDVQRLRRLESGATLAFRITPGQPVYAPVNVLTGAARPHRGLHVWRSEPAQPFPQWLQLDWPAPRTIARVELVFPGHLVREIYTYPPFYRDPLVARDYAVEAWCNGAWTEVLRESDNHQPRRAHVLSSPVVTERIRVVIHATNGASVAALHEVRVYE